MLKNKYSFQPIIAYIKQTHNISSLVKFRWLKETNKFINKTLSQKKRKIWEKFVLLQ